MKLLRTYWQELVLFVSLALVFMFSFIFSNGVVGLWSGDVWQQYVVTGIQRNMMAQGQLPIGVFGLPQLYGGFYGIPSTFSLFYIPDALLLMFQYVTNNFATTIKIFFFIVYFLTQVTSYALIRYYTKSRLASVFGSTIYAFSAWFVTETYWGHSIIIFSGMLVPLAILTFEKFLKSYTPRNALYLFLIMSALITSSFEIFAWTLLMSGFMLIFEVMAHDRAYIKGLFFRIAQMTTIFALLFVPVIAVIMSFLGLASTGAFSNDAGSAVVQWWQFLWRPFVMSEIAPNVTNLAFNFSLLAIPFVGIALWTYKEHARKTIFFIFIFLAFLGFAYLPVSISRAPFRSLVYSDLAFAVLAAFGLNYLLPWLQYVYKKRSLIIVGVIIAITFGACLTVFPTSTPLPLSQAEQFVFSQPIANTSGRIAIVPTVWARAGYLSFTYGWEVDGQAAVELHSYPKNTASQLIVSESLDGLNKLPYKIANSTSMSNNTLITDLIYNINKALPLTGTKYLIINGQNDNLTLILRLSTTFKIFKAYNDSTLMINTAYTPVASATNQTFINNANISLIISYAISIPCCIFVVYLWFIRPKPKALEVKQVLEVKHRGRPRKSVPKTKK